MINGDGVLTPNDVTLRVWRQSATRYGGALHVVVQLLDKLDGDSLSLQSGYDASKVTPVWDWDTGRLSLALTDDATEADIRTALGLLSLNSRVSDEASARRVWVFPILSGVDKIFRYRVDAGAGLLRYYLYDSELRSFEVAGRKAAGRSLFGKDGYLGVHTSNTEKDIYLGLRTGELHLAISDAVQEGNWVITAGPRTGEVLWNDGTSYGAAMTDWSTQGDFWHSGEPDNAGSDVHYARMDATGLAHDDVGKWRYSVAHFDSVLSGKAFFWRKVEVGESTDHPVLEVDVGKLLATSLRPLVLGEEHILVDDPDTRLLSDDTKVDPAKIRFRVSNIVDGKLYERTSTAAAWTEMDHDAGTQLAPTYTFTLLELRGGLISFFADSGVSKIDFEVQALDDGDLESDSDPVMLGRQPVGVSIPAIALKEIEAGQKGAVNDDGTLGRGGITPDTATLQAWMDASSTPLTIFVKLYIGKLQGGKSGLVVLGEGTVKESLSLSKSISNITVVWDPTTDTLSLRGDASTSLSEFRGGFGCTTAANGSLQRG